MSGKTALITGASSNTGRAVVNQLAGCGYNIAAHYFRNVDALGIIENDISTANVKSTFLKYDLRDQSQVKDMIGKVMEDFGRIDVLVNSIGPFKPKKILEVTPDEWREMIDSILQITFNTIYFAMEPICESKGHIINFGFSGVDQLRAWEIGAAYSSAKAGVIILTKTLAKSLAPKGVRVNAVSPGLLEDSPPETVKLAPIGRHGTFDEIGQVVKWLVADSPEYMTGSNIAVSGGFEQ